MLSNDSQTTVAALRDCMREFVAERNWEQFHSPKNLSMSLAIEAAELMEHFQWLTIEQSKQLDACQQQEVGEELADVICYALSIANALNLDITATVDAKMAKNRSKYPAEEFRGRFG